MLQIVRKKLTPDEIIPPYLRYNSDCDCIQTTPDGGSTWVDTPGQDPRSAPGFRKPPNSSPDPQCNAAANMVAGLRSFIELDIEAVSTWQLASGFAAIYLLIFPVGWLIDLLLAIATIILDIGQSNVAAAFTEEVYDGFLCIFYCNIDADGQMSDDGLAAIYDAVAAQFDATVQAVFGAHSSGLGANGWSNIGATGTITDADCSGCDCAPWCYEWDFTVNDGGWDNCFGRGTYSPGVGWVSSVGAGFVASTPNSGNNSDLHANPNHWEVDVLATGAAGNGYVSVASINDVCTFTGLDPGYMSIDGVPTYPGFHLANGLNTYTYDDDGLHSFAGVFVNPVINDEDATVIVTRVRLSGTGALPAFTGGTDCS